MWWDPAILPSEEIDVGGDFGETRMQPTLHHAQLLEVYNNTVIPLGTPR